MSTQEFDMDTLTNELIEEMFKRQEISKSYKKKLVKQLAKHVRKKEKMTASIVNGNVDALATDGMSEEDRYRWLRLAKINEMKANGQITYPHKFHVDISFAKFIEKYKDLDSGSRHNEFIHSIAGRIMFTRGNGNKLAFLVIVSDGYKIQILCDIREYEDSENFKKIVTSVHNGDIVGVRGFAGKSLKNELSIYALELVILTPCLKMIPKHSGLKDPETRARKRYLDLIANPAMRDVFVTRSRVYSGIRHFLDRNGFIEVSTPVLSDQAGGASARPFVTHHNDLDQEMFMRIAPELFLKKLVVGGLNRVYEIGQQFRNEGIDVTHNPEFFSMEFYMAYADYNDLMTMCEEMILELVTNIKKSSVVKYTPLGEEELEIDFTPPFKRIDMMSELEKCLGTTFPQDYHSEEMRIMLIGLCNDHELICAEPQTTARMLDKLVGHFIEPQCINPTFIINHPAVMSPLAKNHRDNDMLTERFELFMAGTEYANAYTELNDPEIQRNRFEEQSRAKTLGDDEAHGIDKSFVDALEYGLPPTGGFGMGIDRFIMLMTGMNRIADVIAFPAMNTI
jgi:lysyl-tRNA synthetase class 2